MSAFLCSDLQTWVAAVATAGLLPDTDGAPAIALQYRALNNAALASRYGDAGVPLESGQAARAKAYKWLEAHSPADVYQVLRCLRYQCSEGEFERRPGWALLTAACDAAAKAAGCTNSPIWNI